MNNPVILFDGVCNFCNGFVNFVIKRDGKKLFRFAPLQSDKGKELLRENRLPPSSFKTFILLEEGEIYKRSTAAIRVLSRLSGIYKYAKAFYVIPKFIRDFVYNIIAKYRYKIFGKREECMIPTDDIKSRFLD